MFLMAMSEMTFTQWFGLLEFPFLILCIYYSFKTASALKGGVFGKGMTLLAWGFLVMAVGHGSMQITHLFGLDIFEAILQQPGGKIAWFLALVATWGLSGYGFFMIYKASKT